MDFSEKKDFKCYNCGTIFKNIHHLNRHKERKTPCLIRDITDEDKKKPYCIFCNRIFCNIGNLNKHYVRCKVKNGGMQILADKVKKEQEERYKDLLEKQQEAMDEQKEAMNKQQEAMNKQQEEINTLKEQIGKMAIVEHRLEPKTGVQNQNTGDHNNNNTVNNNIVNNNITNNTIHVHMNSYKRPSINHIVLTEFIREYIKHGVSIPCEIMGIIYFNDKDAPENLSLYMVNKKTREMLVFDDGKWISSNEEDIAPEVREILYDLTDKMVDNSCTVIETHAKDNPTAPGRVRLMRDRQLTMKGNKYDNKQRDYDLKKLNSVLLSSRHLTKDLAEKRRTTVEKAITNAKIPFNMGDMRLMKKIKS